MGLLAQIIRLVQSKDMKNIAKKVEATLIIQSNSRNNPLKKVEKSHFQLCKSR